MSDKKVVEKTCTEGARRLVCEGNELEIIDTTNNTLSPIERLQIAESKRKFGGSTGGSKTGGMSYAAIKNGQTDSSSKKVGVTYKGIVTGEHTSAGNIEVKEVGGNGYKQVPFLESAKSNVKLKYFVIDSDEVELEPEKEMLDKWSKYLVGHFVGSRMYFYDVRKEMLRLWKILKGVICSENGFYFLEFSNENSMNEMLGDRFCHVFGRVMVVRKWQQMLRLSRSEMNSISVWIRLYNLPDEFWSGDNISRVASKLGRSLYLDQATELTSRLSYVRVCVEINAAKELLNVIKIKYCDDILEVGVKYQWVPFRCELCSTFGHKNRSCRLQPQREQVRPVANRARPQHKITPHPYADQIWKRKVEKAQYYDTVVEGNGGKGKGEDSEDMENLWQTNGKRGNHKVIDRRRNVATMREFKKKYLVKNVLKLSNPFDVIADVGTEQEDTKMKKDRGEASKIAKSVEGEKVTRNEEYDVKKNESNEREIDNLNKEVMVNDNGIANEEEKDTDECLDDNGVEVEMNNEVSQLNLKLPKEGRFL